MKAHQLQQIMLAERMCIEHIAEAMGWPVLTAVSKIYGRAELTYEDARGIQERVFPGYPIEAILGEQAAGRRECDG